MTAALRFFYLFTEVFRDCELSSLMEDVLTGIGDGGGTVGVDEAMNS